MENRVYYGEYSLEHWIKLILKRNIILPDYQRYFVWEKEKTQKLIETFNKKQFVPPVTIGSYNSGDDSTNLILDGQQRLTSILLSYLGIFPDKEIYKKAIEKFADENDNPEEEEGLDNILEWSFKKLTEKGNDKKEILEKLKPGNYKTLEEIDDTFFKTNFLGFSYLVPKNLESNTQQKFYSSVFRNINIQGEILLPQESRAALYFLNSDLVDYFSPKFTKNITVNDLKMDFVRYLALLSQYHKDNNMKRLAYGYAKRMEKYYEEYIYSVVDEEDSNMFGVFPEEFKHNGYEGIIILLNDSFNKIINRQSFKSIIDIDTLFFGLLYIVMFERKQVNGNRKVELVKELEEQIGKFKEDKLHARNPSALKHLKNRIETSINIYRKYKV